MHLVNLYGTIHNFFKGLCMKNLSKAEYAFIVGGALNTIIGLFAGTFLIGQIVSVDSSNVVHLAEYYLMIYSILCVTYLALSIIFKRVNKLITYRISILIKVLYILIIAYSGTFFSNHIVLLGLLYGFSEAFYYFSINYLKTDNIKTEFMKRFVPISSIAGYIINIIFPIIFGYMIGYVNLQIASVVVLAFAVIMYLCSYMISAKPTVRAPFRIKEYLNIIKSDRGKSIRLSYLLNGIEGFRGVHGVFNTMFIVMAFNNTTGLGYVTSAFSVLYIVVATVFLQFNKKHAIDDNHSKKQRAFILIVGILPFMGAMILGYKVDAVTFIIYDTIYLSCITILSLINSISASTLAKRKYVQGYLSEYQCTSEVITAIGRLLAFGLLGVVGLIGNPIVTMGYMLASYIIVPIYAFVVNRLQASLQRDKKLGYDVYDVENIVIEDAEPIEAGELSGEIISGQVVECADSTDKDGVILM